MDLKTAGLETSILLLHQRGESDISLFNLQIAKFSKISACPDLTTCLLQINQLLSIAYCVKKAINTSAMCWNMICWMKIWLLLPPINQILHRNVCMSKKEVFRKQTVEKTDWTGPGFRSPCQEKCLASWSAAAAAAWWGRGWGMNVAMRRWLTGRDLERDYWFLSQWQAISSQPFLSWLRRDKNHLFQKSEHPDRAECSPWSYVVWWRNMEVWNYSLKLISTIKIASFSLVFSWLTALWNNHLF